jgi:hypothetical protein
LYRLSFVGSSLTDWPLFCEKEKTVKRRNKKKRKMPLFAAELFIYSSQE